MLIAENAHQDELITVEISFFFVSIHKDEIFCVLSDKEELKQSHPSQALWPFVLYIE